MKEDRKSLGIILAICAAVCYGMTSLFVETFYTYGGTSGSFNFLKCIIMMVLTLPFIIFGKRSFKLPKDRVLKLLIAGATNYGFVSVLLAESYNYLGGGIATTLHFMYPIFTAVIAFMVFKARMPAYKWILLVVVSLSVLFFVDLSDGQSNVYGIIIAVLSGFLFAVYIIQSDVWHLGAEDIFVMLFYMALGGCVIAAGALLITGQPAFGYKVRAILPALACVLTSYCLGTIFFQKSLKYIDGTEAAFLSVFEPVSTAILNAIFLGEILGFKSIIGIVVILGAVVIMSYLDLKEARKAE